MKVKILGNEENKHIFFVYEDGMKSQVFSSKESACDGAANLYKDNIIDLKEFTELTSEIMKVKYLPYDGRIEKTIHIAFGMISGLAVSSGSHLLEKAKEAVDKIKGKLVRFQMCEGGCLSGRIIYGLRSTSSVSTKENALHLAQALFDSENITAEELATLQKQISISPLVDHAD
jgi:hypothetical protein